ncbi:MAG TPA: M20 family metallopeptidase [Longimicrobiales bacterium]|nr:M20 family metallopeptidase [Longimicrobiales bacterium]
MTPEAGGADGALATRVLEHVRGLRAPMLELLTALARLESPTDRADSQEAVQALLARALRDAGYRTRRVPGRRYGGCLWARPAGRRPGRPLQLLVGHSDTVWPIGTVASMPVREEDGRLHGPGTFDMKAGLTNVVFALRTLSELGLEPPADPVVLVNSDEEVGSVESRCLVRRLASRASRAFVLEPALGPEGKLKTARKGVGTYRIRIRGRAAHAGLDPGAGASAIVELAHVIRALVALDDPASGTTVNVGVVSGGVRPNVVAAEARAEVDVRVPTAADGERVDGIIRGLRPTMPGVSLEVDADLAIPPLERTPRNVRLWERARHAGRALGIELDQATVGGGSDGNTTSRYTATLDGLGAVGDGAHADHEHVRIGPTFDRCALLVMLLMAPVDESRGEAAP